MCCHILAYSFRVSSCILSPEFLDEVAGLPEAAPELSGRRTTAASQQFVIVTYFMLARDLSRAPFLSQNIVIDICAWRICDVAGRHA
jgi:hypothetical protein